MRYLHIPVHSYVTSSTVCVAGTEPATHCCTFADKACDASVTYALSALLRKRRRTGELICFDATSTARVAMAAVHKQRKRKEIHSKRESLVH